jgi:hypothetical protein
MSDEVIETTEETPAVTRPARTKSAAVRRAKATKPVENNVPDGAEEDDEPVPTAPIRLVIEPTGETANYAVFQLPRTSSDGNKSTVCGTIYAPKGTRVVKVLVQP